MKTFPLLLLALVSGFHCSIRAQCCPPVITNQPQSQTVVAGSSVNFTVGVYYGDVPPSYQWRFNGTNIPGATNTSYAIVSAQPTNNGNYSVAMTNQPGWAISS